MEELLKILESIKSLDFKPSNRLDIINQLADIYEEKKFRHSYYELSSYLQSLTEEERDTVSANVDEILAYVNEDEDFKKLNDLSRGIFKLADHINLETLRINRLKNLEFIGEKAKADVQKADEIQKINAESVDQLSKRVEKFHGQSITVLGIFSGLVIGFATGSNMLMETFSHLNELNLPKMLLYILVIGFVLFNIIFMLMYCVSKIVGSSIAATCRKKSCELCKKHRIFLTRLIHKYPYVFAFNVISLLLILLIYLDFLPKALR